MRLLDTSLLSLCVAAFIIGVHQIITVGFAQGYWLIMLSSILFLWYSIRKRKAPPADAEKPKISGKKKPRKSATKKKRSSN